MAVQHGWVVRRVVQVLHRVGDIGVRQIQSDCVKAQGALLVASVLGCLAAMSVRDSSAVLVQYLSNRHFHLAGRCDGDS